MPGSAAEAPPYTTLLHQSLAHAPALREQAANVGAAGADAAQARAWLNPRVDTIFENLGAPQSGGVSQRQNTYTITQPLEIGGKRGARIEAGQRGLAAAEARERQARVTYAAELAVAYATAEAMLGRKALAAEDRTRAAGDLRAARAQVQSGKEAALRVAQAQASVSAAQAAEQAAIAEATQALERLAALAGSDEPYTAVSTSLLATANPAPANAIKPGETLAVLTAQAERDALNAQVQVERKKWIPEVGVSAGLRRYGWTNASGYVVGLSATIPLFDRNDAATTAAVEREAAAEARLDSVRLEAAAAQRSALAQAAASEKRLAAAAEGEQAATEAYRLGRIGYDAGKTSLIELLATRRALFEAKGLTIDARLARVRALAALAQAEGRLAFEETP
ncbi:TolC family protein [Ralstonia pseudosolanacearum]|nr:MULTISPECIES: TolC family protein [Ralstonia]MDO3505797.1 TolC family protein [Ralstonia pseudosolanacearum]MDO3510996.1 TolC family protein [Ralstonia pseudosolanacearum]MDO3535490.1 TolC family protein [Ralstonia pseudosolanacearum]MDO3574794.1 TolC family protein [Ralstonia pseudosolanacearum]MDO3584654.1 TolC family protein [Ralstonia pseudosolanacearum]